MISVEFEILAYNIKSSGGLRVTTNITELQVLLRPGKQVSSLAKRKLADKLAEVRVRSNKKAKSSTSSQSTNPSPPSTGARNEVASSQSSSSSSAIILPESSQQRLGSPSEHDGEDDAH